MLIRLQAWVGSMQHDSATVLDLNQLRRSCGSCALVELCLPAGISAEDLKQLDATVKDKRSLDRGAALYRDGDAFDALYVVRSGSLKTFVQNEDGDQQILGFHLPGEIVGFDAMATNRHISQAEALERTSICELPYDQLQQVVSKVPALHRQLMRVISREVVEEHRHLVMMGKQQAQEQLAIFLMSLSDRYKRLHLDSTTLSLSMSRYDIANYLGIVVETVSRLFTRMEEMGVLEVNRKSIHIRRPDLLAGLCGAKSMVNSRRETG
ncbi:MAG TPA: fumarate/nitrate reduction transcriptional regulator Fnr [Rhodanobacter sp.]